MECKESIYSHVNIHICSGVPAVKKKKKKLYSIKTWINLTNYNYLFVSDDNLSRDYTNMYIKIAPFQIDYCGFLFDNLPYSYREYLLNDAAKLQQL